MIDNIINDIKSVCIEVSRHIRHTDPILDSKEIAYSNAAGDSVKKLDVIANELLKDRLRGNTNVGLIGSEEEPEIIETGHDSDLLVCFDPLDGSSNIRVNITVGTIYAIYRVCESKPHIRCILASGYCLYGNSTLFVETRVHKPVVVSLLDATDQFEVVNDNLRIPKRGSVYAINQSNIHRFLEPKFNVVIEKFIAEEYTQRWVGSLVADAHRTLIKGGFFSYPGTFANCDGKLRLLYEVLPFAFVFFNAGGYASDGDSPFFVDPINVDIAFDNPHIKVPCVLCGPSEAQLFNNE